MIKLNPMWALGLCLVCLSVAATAEARTDYDTDSGAYAGGHTTVHRKHVIHSDESTGTNADDYNFIGTQGSLLIAIGSTGGFQLQQSGNDLGMLWGAYYERRFIPYLGLRAEFNYDQRGFSTGTSNNGNSYYINYFEIPLSIKAQIPTSIVTPFVAVGPYVGFAVAKGGTFTQDGQSGDVQNGGSLFNGFNFGFNFGGGVDFELIRHLNAEIGVRYSMGLLNVLSTTGQQEVAAGNGLNPNDLSIHLSDVQFLTGLSYSL